MEKLIPADTVDANGNVWETMGENIRRRAKETSIGSMKAIVDVLFPVGSVLCGENAFITSVGKWEQMRNASGLPFLQGDSVISGKTISRAAYTTGEDMIAYPSLRMFRRIA